MFLSKKVLAKAYALALGRPKFCSCSVYRTKIRGFHKAICKKLSAVHFSAREFDSKGFFFACCMFRRLITYAD